MHSKVSSDWQPSYIKATQPVLEIFKLDGYFPDRPCNLQHDLEDDKGIMPFPNVGNSLIVDMV
jgi:hypothetical protein